MTFRRIEVHVSYRPLKSSGGWGADPIETPAYGESVLAVAVVASLTAHAPVLVHDARERYPVTAVAASRAAAPGLPQGPPRAVIYGRVAGEWLQYWLFR